MNVVAAAPGTLSTRQIANRIGISMRTVQRYLKKLDCKPAGGTPYFPFWSATDATRVETAYRTRHMRRTVSRVIKIEKDDCPLLCPRATRTVLVPGRPAMCASCYALCQEMKEMRVS